MKDLIGYIARRLVGRPVLVTVSEMKGNPASIYEPKVAPQDLGKVIGRQGRNVSALRTILNAVAGKAKKKTILKIIG